jgi:hypothetical protein
MAKYARQLADGNPALGPRLEVVQGKVEEVKVPEKVRYCFGVSPGPVSTNSCIISS